MMPALALCVIVLLFCGCQRSHRQLELAVDFSESARIEVGGPFVGAEFHNSYPVPQRISFFYPIANSIDQSNEYWTRDTSLVMDVRLKVGGGEWENISRETTQFNLTPFSVSFTQKRTRNDVGISYKFCRNKPAMVVTITVANTGTASEVYSLRTRLNTALRTCHTFRKIEEGWTRYQPGSAALYTQYL
ncbi:hypothetical protein ACFL45_08420, partial [Candidatus Neomarinimicrobiota bacterium]